MLDDKNISSIAWNIITLSILFLALKVISWRLNEGMSLGAYHIKNNSWLGKLQITWVLNFFAPFFLANTLNNKDKIFKIMNGLVWSVSALAITMLYSRTGFLTLTLTTTLIFVLNLGQFKKLILSISLFASAFLFFLLNNSFMKTQLFSSLINFYKDNGMKNRINIWKESFQMFMDHPITGIGFGTYDHIAYTQYLTQLDQFAGIKNTFFKNGWHAHNFMLHTLTETGLFGFFSWIYICYTIFLYIRIYTFHTVNKLKNSILISLFLSFFILSSTENLLAVRVHESFRMNLTFWFLVLYALGSLTPENERLT
ncbi:MAG: O-antigen ligase family protein [Elusimicrobia bacterium]|nr:O-antigen ligase family protein [Elusimicrobiota bacterium]